MGHDGDDAERGPAPPLRGARRLVAADLPPEEYAEEAGAAGALLASAAVPVREVLELGNGGGHVASHLEAPFAMTLVDASDAMLDVSRRLNPGCEHRRGGMRTVRLGCRDRWLGLLAEAGFEPEAVAEETSEPRAPRELFVGHRPLG
jgi:hypothetical protein